MLKQEDSTKKKIYNEKYNHQSIVSVTPHDLIKIAMDKRKATAIKKKVRKTVGCKNLYWDHIFLTKINH